MDESRIASIEGSRGRVSFQIDGVVMAVILEYKNYTRIYTSRHLSMNINEIKKLFSESVFLNPQVEISPHFLKDNTDTYYAKVKFDKSVSVYDIKEAIYSYRTRSVVDVNDINHQNVEDLFDSRENDPNDSDDDHIPELTKDELEQIKTENLIIEEDIEKYSLEGADKTAVVKTRVNQGVFRDLLIRKYERCCLCGTDEEELLVASHIKPWAVSTGKERIDVENGLLLCPNHDKLFDRGYITFDEEGKIMISDKLSDTNQIYMNINSEMSIPMSKATNEYMQYHHDNIFIG